MKTKLHYVLPLFMFLSVFSLIAQQSYWQKTNTSDIDTTTNGNETSKLNQKFYQTYQLDIEALKSELINAPNRRVNFSTSNIKVYFPNIKGQLEQFTIVEAPVLSEELSNLYPNIKTYIGFGIDTPGARARFSITPQGLQSMISYPNEPVNFVVPNTKGSDSSYIAYSRDVRTKGIKDFNCLTKDEFLPIDRNDFIGKDANDQILRTFRIAISTTGEYTNFWDDGDASNGDAQADALAQVVSTLNRCNEVFEVDMAVTFTLVTGTEIIYSNADTDPYDNNFNTELQVNLTANVGEANYDIGHLFHFGFNSGDAGCIGCVCVNGNKGSGFSSHTFQDNDGGPYMSDFFDIDYVPHEIGHQMGANHTWSFDNEGTGVNAEPGSGTTIMGYAGIVLQDDVQDHSDPYFHYYSISQILNNLNIRTCWTSTTITNNPPTANAGNDYTIPVGTAFVLRGSATDINTDDILTYTWEQIDNGLTSFDNFGPTKTSGALWRSRPPSTSPDRYMPIVERVISGNLTEVNPVETPDNSSWETVSTVTRDLNFALIVRDRSETNGINQMPQNDFDEMQVTVDAASGPFVVTSQTTNEIWTAESIQTITWDVAGTNSGSVNTPTVNILLSTDGGFTYPTILASNVTNDGSHDITLPVVNNTTAARVKVEGNNNIFYAINSTNFTIDIPDNDNDGIVNGLDNCPDIPNVDQADTDNDGVGDVCDDDIDGDGILNDDDNCITTPNSDQSDMDNDDIGDVCDDDIDGDGILNDDDNCSTIPNTEQVDTDMDGLGDLCDDDDDNDGILDNNDNCQFVSNPDQIDIDGNSIGDACEEIIVNNIITPNGDNINDTWVIQNSHRIPNAVINVYNRWGNLVFTSTNYNNDWDGTSKSTGETLPTGSYYYIIDTLGNGEAIITGWIYITL